MTDFEASSKSSVTARTSVTLTSAKCIEDRLGSYQEKLLALRGFASSHMQCARCAALQ